MTYLIRIAWPSISRLLAALLAALIYAVLFLALFGVWLWVTR